jgi:leader peptidase (prepilin peptidase)/N-methyltransferase
MKRAAGIRRFFINAAIGRNRDALFCHVVWLSIAAWVPLGAGFMMEPPVAIIALAAASGALFLALAIIVAFDALYFIVPDRCLIVLAVVGAALAADGGFATLGLAALAAASGYGALRLIDMGYERLRGEPGLGHGDAKLMAVVGLWTGIEGMAGCVIYAVGSALVSVLMMRRARTKLDRRTAIPFGPHLALGFWLVRCVGPPRFV